MFGYIRPLVSEFDNYLFKSEYCSLCKTLGGRYGQLSRFLISYDITLLALVLSSLKKEPFQYRYENCLIHPVKKRRIKLIGEVEDFSAEVTAVMFRNKFLDQIRDEKGIQKSLYRSVYRMTGNWEKRIKNKKLLMLNKSLDEIYLLETVQKSSDVDVVSNAFGSILKRIMMIAADSLSIKIPVSVYDFSFLLGKWIYLMDAFEDLRKDLRKWSYNPLILSNKDLLLDGIERDDLIQDIVTNEKWRLELLLDHMYDCFMRFEKYLGVYNYEIDGIISRAIPVMTRRILDKTTKTTEKEEETDGE
ncbi:MAG TPA: DUF5685 family protein [Thermotogota bacterium]|nr:DUF5685 family protein [Thermotogota bacterium]HPJ88148.1 DUF5685 family protein [Thermotogota bacterium]HPR95581.1 DUF5685 family protein [Thermotogota bacterium]